MTGKNLASQNTGNLKPNFFFFIITRKIWGKFTRNLEQLEKIFLGSSRNDRKGFSFPKHWKNLGSRARIFSFSSQIGKFEGNL